jgi:hypothetical protein
MGVKDQFDNMKEKAKDVMGSQDESDEKVEAAADKVDEATGGKMSDKVDKGEEMAKEGIDKLKH